MSEPDVFPHVNVRATSRIPEERNACVKCEDFMAEHVSWAFDFYFVLSDEEGETLLVNVGSEAVSSSNLWQRGKYI